MPSDHLFIAPTRIGDAVLANCLLEYLRQTDATARVTIIASPFAAALYNGYPNLEALHIIGKKRLSLHWWQIWRIAVMRQWDSLWDLRGSALAYICPVRQRYIFTSTPDAMAKRNQFEQRLGLTQLPYPTLWAQKSDHEKAEQLMAHAEVIALAPCANFLGKEWPITHYIALARRLFGEQFKGYRPMIICAAHEHGRATPLLEALKEYQPIDATNGSLSLLEIYACLRKAKGFIGNDSGLMHIAAAASIPTLGLFGPTDDVTYAPCGLRSQSLVAPERDLTKLSPQTVLEHFVLLVTRDVNA